MNHVCAGKTNNPAMCLYLFWCIRSRNFPKLHVYLRDSYPKYRQLSRYWNRQYQS